MKTGSWQKVLNKKLLAAVLGAGLLLSPCDGMAISVSDVTSWSAGVNVRDVANGVDIESNVLNNVINWNSFDIAQGETVRFDAYNYLNLIHDNKASEILGTLIGGGNIYLINPNGVLFGDNSSVNVGNLYVSTNALTAKAISDFEKNGTNPLAGSVANGGDIMNLGKIQADSVYFEGNVVMLKNADDITKDGKDRNGQVTINARDAIEVGNAGNVESVWAHNIDITEYTLIYNFNELKNMGPGGNYMLAIDIDAGRVSLGVIADTYYGSFNGLDHKIKNLYINAEGNSHVGLFGNLSSTGVVKNLTLVNCDIRGVEDVGAFAGYVIAGGRIDNCHTVDGNIQGTEFVGGIAGTVKGGMITNSDNSAAVNGWNCVGGIVGIADTGPFELDNCHNYGDVVCNDDPSLSHYRDERYYNAFTGGLIGRIDADCKIIDSSNNGTVSGTTDVGGLIGLLKSSEESGLVLSNVNRGDVAGTDSIGGLIGKHLCGTVQGNINYGKVSGAFFTGEIVGDTFDDSIYDHNISYANQLGVPTDSIVNEMISEAVDKIYHGAETIGLNRVLKVFSVAEDYQRLNLDTILLQQGLNINLAGQAVAGNTLPVVQFEKDEE